MTSIAIYTRRTKEYNSELLTRSKGLRWFSKFHCLTVLFLIFMGALVKSHEAGLSVPDWPTSYGENMFLFHPSKWIGGIFYEHVHRLIASGVGVLTLILACWSFFSEKRYWLRLLSYVAVVVVTVQGVLGGLTVIYQLPDAISVAHGVLAQTFLVLSVIIAYGHSREFEERQAGQGNFRFFVSAIALIALVYMQLFIGALMRHADAGLAVLDIPTTGGAIVPMVSDQLLTAANQARSAMFLPAVSTYQLTVHVLHRIGGVIVALAALGLAWRIILGANLPRWSKRTSLILGSIVVIQFLLGISVILSFRAPWVASAHVVMGAALLAVSVLLALRLYPFKYKA